MPSHDLRYAFQEILIFSLAERGRVVYRAVATVAFWNYCGIFGPYTSMLEESGVQRRAVLTGVQFQGMQCTKRNYRT